MSSIKTSDLSVGYDEKALIENIALEVERGKIVALIGPNGAGKSTILKTVSGLLEEIKGNVFIDSKALSELSLNEKATKIAVMMTQRVNENYLTVKDVVAVGRYPYTGLMGTLSSKDNEEINKALSLVGAGDLVDREFSKLSDGQKQRVLLSRAIAQRPDYMVLDEPTSFLDIGYKLSFLETLKELSRSENIGIIMSMHELEMAAYVADLVVCVSEDRRIDKIGKPSEIFKTDYIEKLFNVPSGLIDKTYRFNHVSNPVAEVKERLQNPKAHFLMVQGTMSSAGKSLIVAGLCRIFKQDGYRVAPFKSQNMALNSFITEDGLEMGRAQVMQAEAAGIKPSVYMNPILLKPTSESGSQVIVNGKVVTNMRAKDYFKYKTQLVPDILTAVEKLEEVADIIVIEGAGSPAEINLKTNDIVNMGMAKMVDAPVLLVGDIDRGGVFAQLLGTIELLEPEERNRVKGLIVNKFRGDKTILDPGLEMLEERGHIPVTGVVPYMHLNLEDEDSLSEKFDRKETGLIKVGVIRLPHIANFTDFDTLNQLDEVAVHYISNEREIEDVDLLIIPGSKNTISDMVWLKESGLEAVIKKYSAKNKPLMGICGGYQMLGATISDPSGVECLGEVTGLDILPVNTVLAKEKHTSQVSGSFINPTGIFENLKGLSFDGYEIHMGETEPLDASINEFTSNASGYCKGNVFGTYVHGIFDCKEVLSGIIEAIATNKGIDLNTSVVKDYRELKEAEYDKLADTMREYMDMDAIYKMMGINR